MYVKHKMLGTFGAVLYMHAALFWLSLSNWEPAICSESPIF